jgi:hypothetical protein
MAKTRFNIQLTLRIAQETSGVDRITKDEILEMLRNRTAEIVPGSSSQFVSRKSDGKILAQVEEIVLK